MAVECGDPNTHPSPGTERVVATRRWRCHPTRASRTSRHVNPLHRICSVLPLLLAIALATACATGAREPTPSNDPAPRGYVEADVRFMRGMITHHVQAIDMTDLVAERTGNEDIHRLARRIEISQLDEIARMERWLEARGEDVPEGHDHGRLMPGMLTEEEMARLAKARGDSFDRLFLEGMIEHHEGALVMVEDLVSNEGAGQEAEIYLFTSHVDADQRAEIARMRAMLSTISRGGNE